MVDMKKATVRSTIERIKKTGSPLPGHSTEPHKKLNERDLRSLERIVRKDPFFSFNQILYELRLRQIHLSKPTLVKYLHSLGFDSYFAAQKPDLEPKDIKNRLRWAKERANWTNEQWRGIVWSDISLYAMEGYDGGARVVRKASERYNLKHIEPVSKFGKRSVMAWGCFWSGGFGPLVKNEDKIDQDACVHMLAKNFLPWFEDLSQKQDRDFTFQEDGATTHTGGYTAWWKDVHAIRRFDY